MKFSVENIDSRIGAARRENVFKINDPVTRFRVKTDGIVDIVIAQISSTLRQLANVRYKDDIVTTLKPITSVAVGAGCVYSSSFSLDQQTGKRGVTDALGIIEEMTISLSSAPTLSFKLVIDAVKRLGISPAIRLETVSISGSVITASGIDTDPANNEFADPDGGLTDLDMFGAFKYSNGSGSVERVNDDDFVGFVFGYSSPNITTLSNDNHFYLFDWKKVGQHAPDEFGGLLAQEGFTLSRADGVINNDPVTTYKYFWAHESGVQFTTLDSKYGNDISNRRCKNCGSIFKQNIDSKYGD
jgi:hypothetical protein